MNGNTLHRFRGWIALSPLALLALAGCPGISVPGGGNNTGNDMNSNTNTTTTPPAAVTNDKVGRRGLDSSAGLPGMLITIMRVSGATTDVGPATGQPFNVQFSLKDGASKTISISDLDRFSIYVSGPADNYQRVIVPEGDLKNSVKDNGDGTYTYAFANPFPTTYAAPYFDSDAFGVADGELTGQLIDPGTYTVGIEARRKVARGDATLEDAGDATLDFPIGDVAVNHREVVTQENCMACHGQFSVHGGNRFSLTGCVLCHTAGGEDLISKDPAKATPGVTIQLAHMIHSIHKGVENPLVTATKNSADPYRYKIVGFGESVIDFSDVEFPYMPGGTGFNEQTRNCVACHGGAKDGDRAYTHPSRSACTGCHTDLDFTSGTVLDATNTNGPVFKGTLTQGQLSDKTYRMQVGGTIKHTFKDTECTLCHTAGTPLDPATLHTPVLADPANIVGLKVVVNSVTGNSGAGFFQAGDKPVVQFTIVDKDNNAIDMSKINSVSLVLSGPVGNYQKILPTSGTGAVTLRTLSVDGSTNTSTGGLAKTGVGPFTYTSPTALPSTVPASYVPTGITPTYTYASGWGNLSGQNLPAGSYTLLVYAYRNVISNGVTFRETSEPGLYPIRVGSAGNAVAYSGIVTDDKCGACHNDLRFHGNTRKSVRECVLCHAAGVEYSPAGTTVDFKVMVHKIHNARNLTNKYMLGTNDFSDGGMPYLVGEAKNCTACHATDEWKTPTERSDVAIWKVACTSCHDSSDTAVHVQLNTLPGNLQEACATCHGDGKPFAVSAVHQLP